MFSNFLDKILLKMTSFGINYKINLKIILGLLFIGFLFIYNFKKSNQVEIKLDANLVKHRDDFGNFLNGLDMKVGIEIGVRDGSFSEMLLRKWKSFELFYLIDPWMKQENYVDLVNDDTEHQVEIMKIAQEKLNKFGQDRLRFIRNFSANAVKSFNDSSIDFIYIDARHDYCAALEDLNLYYPKLKCGGLMSGHDFIDVYTQKKIFEGQDWSLCSDGKKVMKNGGSVKGRADFLN